ncbi:hypothetical protein D2T29_12675 [Sinirhodobacter populi]|uniref:Uncharacterized protein n=1 Tax=Paenirhodobacter populi TaxID=2306993 RepID=A0A443KCF8_9RHOB|nr:hypothetical protein [Sinirhodobacter populi]RWR30519.1 hypothetical protein D2T29_12675 [Sinirhodobacter populi]
MFSQQNPKPQKFWIVNEDGLNIEINNGVSTDGCTYEIINSTTVYRVNADPNGEVCVTGEFDLHLKPFDVEKCRITDAGCVAQSK